MADYPALPLWTDAYLADTMHLGAMESGAYLHLLMAAWRSPDCSLPDNDRQLARMARCTPREWQRIRESVMAFWTLDGATKMWTQKRLLREQIRVRERSGNQSRKAKLKWLKERENRSAAASAGHVPVPSPDDPYHIHIHNKDTPNGVSSPPIRPLRDVKVSEGQSHDRRPRKTRLQADWKPDERDRDAARAYGLTEADIDTEADRFRNHALANARRQDDWHHAWRNWCNSPYRKPTRVNGGGAVTAAQQLAQHRERDRRGIVLALADELGGRASGAGDGDGGDGGTGVDGGEF